MKSQEKKIDIAIFLSKTSALMDVQGCKMACQCCGFSALSDRQNRNSDWQGAIRVHKTHPQVTTIRKFLRLYSVALKDNCGFES